METTTGTALDALTGDARFTRTEPGKLTATGNGWTITVLPGDTSATVELSCKFGTADRRSGNPDTMCALARKWADLYMR